MCWEMDYEFFVEQQRAQEARVKQEKRADVIYKLLTEVRKPAEEASVKEVVPAK